MKFDTPATTNPIDQMKVVGKPVDRIDGPLKTTGRAPYAYERHDVAPNAAYGYAIGAAVAKGEIKSIDVIDARTAPGVIAVLTARQFGGLAKAQRNTAKLLANTVVDHYHQVVACVIAETFEQARAAAALVKVKYATKPGSYDLAAAKAGAQKPPRITAGPSDSAVGDFDGAFAAAPLKVDATYTTPDQAHAMMEPHASVASWDGDKVTVWTSHQMINWAATDLATTLGIPKENVRMISPYVGGGFGGKLFVRADAVLAALASRAIKRPVKVNLQRALMFNNTPHRPATIQRVRIGATADGQITAIAHESWSGDLAGGRPDGAVHQTRLLYTGANRMTATRLAVLDLPEANAMRAPGEATGHMALEVAMDEMAEKLGMDPVEFRLKNDAQVVPDNPPEPSSTGSQAQKPEVTKPEQRQFSMRSLAECFRVGKEKFGWSQRQAKPGSVKDDGWLIGMGVASAIRGNNVTNSAARVRLERDGTLTVETDMTDIGTGSYTIIAQTAAETLGLPLDRVKVVLGDSSFPVSVGSGGQRGGNCSTAGVYAACMKLRDAIAQKLGLSTADTTFVDGEVRSAGKSIPIDTAATGGPLIAEDGIEFGELNRQKQQSTFGAHFVEVAVDRFTFEVRIRRMLAVCASGRILNPKTARSQVIGAMTMGAGAALMEELAIDKRRGFFANHDLASYEVPVHADIPHQDVIFLDETDAMSSPMKAKGVSELGICGVAAAVANAIYNATGIRVRDYPITLDRLLEHRQRA